MDAFLLSAGRGSRLSPLTDTRPKPLVELNGRPLIDRNLQCLKEIGCGRVIINTHYLPQMIYDFVGDGSKWGLEVIFSYEPVLLDSGGGLKNIFDFISTDKFVTWNADVFIDPLFSSAKDGFLQLLETSSRSTNPLISLLVKNKEEVLKLVKYEEEFSELKVDKCNNLVGFMGQSYSKFEEGSVDTNVFCGISIIRREISAYFPINKPIFSLTRDIFPLILSEKSLSAEEKIKVSYCNYYWNDIGTPARLNDASYNLK